MVVSNLINNIKGNADMSVSFDKCSIPVFLRQNRREWTDGDYRLNDLSYLYFLRIRIPATSSGGHRYLHIQLYRLSQNHRT